MTYDESMKVWHYWNDLRFGPWEISVIMAIPLDVVVEEMELLYARAREWAEAYAVVINEAIARQASMLERSFAATEERLLN